MPTHEFKIPISIGMGHDTSIPLPKRKAREAALLDAVINLGKAFGMQDVEIGEIFDAPDGSGKVVTMRGSGDLDTEGLFQSLLREEYKGETE